MMSLQAHWIQSWLEVIVTHEMNFAREVADRILFMEDGVIVEDAPPEEFFEHPKNDRIRQFIRKVEER